MGLSLTGFNWISNKLIETAEKICDSKIIFTLEGGYNLKALAGGVCNSIRALMDDSDFSDPLGRSPVGEPDISKLVKELKKIHQI
jgi:acetoin utilization deacetylase AcuC-like enzyme